VVFLQDYDMRLGRLLTRGCDVWLNNPRRPMEASGTSGMKAALNGLLNLSIPDGWWAEAAAHGVNGWNIGEATPHDDDRDADHLYRVLWNEVLPAWEHDRARWLEMMRAAVTMAETRFSTARMVAEYYEKLYAARADGAVALAANS
jgi:starch phosphorylase